MFMYKTTLRSCVYIHYKNNLSTCNGFHITYFSNQQFSSVLISLFVDTFSLEVKEKISLRIKHSKVGILLFTNIALALLRRDTSKILRYKSLYATRILENDALLIVVCP